MARPANDTALAGVPERYRIVGLISLGYPADHGPPRRRKPVAELTRWVAGAEAVLRSHEDLQAQRFRSLTKRGGGLAREALLLALLLLFLTARHPRQG